MAEPARQMIHGVAVDAGSGLEAAIREARGSSAQSDDLVTFKRHVLKALGPGATTVLVDAACGPDLLADYPQGCDPMIAYEADVYHISDEDRMTVLPDNLSISDYPRLGVKRLKFFMYYGPDDPSDLNAKKVALAEKVGRECATNNVQYLFEPLVYHRDLSAGTQEFARRKPDLVKRATEAFSGAHIQADVLKVEIPVDLNFVEGFGEPLMSSEEALEAFRMAAAPAQGRDLVYLSAGVSFELFEASLRLARQSGVDFSGFMCGRAIWSDAVSVFGTGGEGALADWLADTGMDRLNRLIEALN